MILPRQIWREVSGYYASKSKNEALLTKDIYEKAIRNEGFNSITTEIIPAVDHIYFEAEDYHQKYLKKNPNGYDCHARTGVFFPAVV